MPTYDYHCANCDHEFEQYTTIANRDSPTELPCPNCSQKAVTRAVSAGLGFTMDKPPPLSGDFRNLLGNIKRKNTTMFNKSTVNEHGPR